MINLGERIYELHFYECYDECFYLTECELNEWFNEIKDLINDDSMSEWLRLQKLIACITKQ